MLKETKDNPKEEEQHPQIENGEEMEDEDELLDDDYLFQLHKYLQEMKRQRKEAEQDANTLSGRIRCLQDEEKKTLKKIEVTRKRTENKMNQLQSQEEDLRRKMEFRNRKNKEFLLIAIIINIIKFRKIYIFNNIYNFIFIFFIFI